MRHVAAAVALALCLAGSRPAGAADDLSDLAFHPHPGARLPLATGLFDEQGRQVSLARFFGGQPVLLVLEYLRCKNLCGLTLERLAVALDALPLAAGRDYQLVAISIDPSDTPEMAAAAKAKYLAGYRHDGGEAGVHFLTGTTAAVGAVAQAIGFPYRYDPDTGQYIHPVGFIVAGRDGTISRYFLGFDLPPSELRAGLADASAGRASGPLTRLLLLCHLQGVPLGRWTVPIEAGFAIANLAAVLGLVAVFAAIRRRRHG